MQLRSLAGNLLGALWLFPCVVLFVVQYSQLIDCFRVVPSSGTTATMMWRRNVLLGVAKVPRMVPLLSLQTHAQSLARTPMIFNKRFEHSSNTPYNNHVEHILETQGVRAALREIIQQAVIGANYNSGPTQQQQSTAVDVVASTRPNVHYQTSIAMKLSKIAKQSPQVIANNIITNLRLGQEQDNRDDAIIESAEFSNPGFINIVLTQSFLDSRARKMWENVDRRCGIRKLAADAKRRTVVDFSSPNIAKEMHVVGLVRLKLF
jgi:hypothetical protein